MTAGKRWNYTHTCQNCGNREEGATNWLIVMLVSFVRHAMQHGHCPLPPSPPPEPVYSYRVTWIDKDGNEIQHTETLP